METLLVPDLDVISPRDRVEMAAALLDPVRYSRDWDCPTERWVGGDRGAWIKVAPGVITVRTGRVAGWEETDRDAYDVASWYQPDRLFQDHQHVDQGDGGTRSVITEWSRKSRRNMLRVMASCDWSPLLERTDDFAPAMVTLTYPTDWQAVAPDGATCKAHLRRFRLAWERHVGPAVGSWKLEFQGRGAPHYHLLLRTPKRRIVVRGREVNVHDFVSDEWARIVGADNELVGDDGRTERERHRVAGCNVDFSFCARMTDAFGIAAYFAKHSAPGATSSKEYQHDVPELWQVPGAGPGRFWGVWAIDRCEVEVEVREADAVEALRFLRRWSHSTVKVRPVVVRRIDRRTGVIRYRKSHERTWVGGPGSAHNLRCVLAKDAPGLLAQLCRAISPPVDWPKGLRRPLP